MNLRSVFSILFISSLALASCDDGGTGIKDEVRNQVEDGEDVSAREADDELGEPAEGLDALVADPEDLAEQPAAIACLEGSEVIPQTTLHLSVEDVEPEVGQVTYRWSAEQPVGSVARFLPSEFAVDPTFTANVAGTYKFTLELLDQEGQAVSQPISYSVDVFIPEGFHVELLWTTPAAPGVDQGSDLDLHFLNYTEFLASQPDSEELGYFKVPFDVFWFNPQPDQGVLGLSDDDPSLDLDDTDGNGPENVNLGIEGTGEYLVAVHNWDDKGLGNSLATVRVYNGSTLVYELVDVELEQLDLLEVCRINVDTGEVQAIEDGLHKGFAAPTDL